MRKYFQRWNFQRSLYCSGKRSDSGFTLIELLVVLAVMGLALAAAPTVFSSARSSMYATAEANALASDLRRSRNAAIMSNHEVLWGLSLPHGKYGMIKEQRNRLIREGVDFKFIGRRHSSDENLAVIWFFPDGSSTGGKIELMIGERAHSVIISRLNGRVSVDE